MIYLHLSIYETALLHVPNVGLETGTTGVIVTEHLTPAFGMFGLSLPKNNIDRAELWASQYTFPKKKDPSIMSDQCSFANTVEGTELFLKTSPFSRLAYHYMYNNEVLTNNWIDVEVSQVPVEAYFYTNPNQDLSLLQSSQLIARAKGIDIPIVFIETPVIKFIYRPQDQAK